MKKIALILSLLIFSMQIGFSIDGDQGKVAAKITFDKLVNDYGKIKKGADGVCYFTYKNEGNDVLFISRVIKSCGCTTPEFSQEPLPPGQTAKIKIGYDTKIVGVFNKTITVFSNAENSTVILTIKGEIVE